MKCRKCGAGLPEGAHFCRECGTQVSENKIQFCRECGRKLETGTRFCPECGTPVQEIPLPESTNQALHGTNAEPEKEKQHREQNAGSDKAEKRQEEKPSPLSLHYDEGYQANPRGGREGNPELDKESNPFIEAIKKSSEWVYRKFMDFWTPLSRYGKIMTSILAVLTILLLTAFCAGHPFAGVLALIQIVLVSLCGLLHNGKIKEPKPHSERYLMIAAAVLLVPYFLTFVVGKNTNEPVESPDVALEQTEAVYEAAPVETEDKVPATVPAATTQETAEATETVQTESEAPTVETLAAEPTAVPLAEAPEFGVQIQVNCAENLIFSKYDLEVSIDGNLLGSLKHGASEEYDIDLTKGCHIIEFTSAESADVFGDTEFQVNEEMLFIYDLHCTASEVVVELNHSESMRPLGENEAKIPQSAESFAGRDINEVFNELEALGFSDKEIVEIKDTTDEEKLGTIKSISVDGNKAFSKGTIFNKDSKIIAEIHAPAWTDVEIYTVLAEAENQPAAQVLELVEENGWEEAGFSITYTVDNQLTGELEPEGKFFCGSAPSTNPRIIMLQFLTEERQAAKLVLQEKFPQKNALKAAVVGLTNGQATDVFAWDGNSLDASKFHNYTDMNGFYLTVLYSGQWLPENENTWHVDGIECMMSGTGTCIKADMDISFENNQYQISNLDRTIASRENLDSDDPSKTNFEHIDPSADTPYLTVPAYKIQGERDLKVEQDRNNRTMPTAERTRWINSQFSIWDGHHEQLTDMIKASLNDESSYEHIETVYVDITSPELLDEVKNALSLSGIYKQLDVGDLVITVKFSAKNAFNATIKGNAIGIARYSTNTIELVAIE